MAKKFSQFPSASSISPGDSVVGLKDGANTRFSFATFLSAIQSLFVPTSRKVNNKALTTDITLNASDVGAVDTADVGVADGVASLDSNGKVPGTQLDLSGKQSTITANGILKGDGVGGVSAATAGTDYQAPLTIDATPTANSTNPVQSGGVHTDVRTRVPVYGLGKNLLDNWYFVNPVNQRGQSSYSTDGAYTIDRWRLGGAVGTASFDTSGVLLSNLTLISQYVDIKRISSGEKYTISALWSNGLITATGILTKGSGVSSWQISTDTYPAARMCAIRQLTASAFQFICQGDATNKIIAAKLELGTEQTLAHQENGMWILNEIPDYEEELIKCQTSTADSTDTYANKSLATEQQLAYVETGTTASRNYTAGQYISLNGLLYTADTAIASGATFYTSGGNKNLTECVGGGLNYLSGGMRLVEYPNLQFTFQNSQASVTKTISSIDSNLSNAKAVLAWCTSSGTPIFPYINTARTVIGIYSPAGSINATITVRLIAFY